MEASIEPSSFIRLNPILLAGAVEKDDFVDGQIGENFRVEGLPDALCIGDRYQSGTALFEIKLVSPPPIPPHLPQQADA